MIDLNAVKCIGAMAAALIAVFGSLWLLDWFWGGKAVRPLKEKSAEQKAQDKKRARSAAQRMANAPESRWMRPGGPLQPSRRPAPIFGEGQPRHIRIDDTPHVIIPHVTVGPTQTGHASYQRNLPATKIKPVEVDTPALPESKPDIKPNKINKSNRTMPMKRID